VIGNWNWSHTQCWTSGFAIDAEVREKEGIFYSVHLLPCLLQCREGSDFATCAVLLGNEGTFYLLRPSIYGVAMLVQGIYGRLVQIQRFVCYYFHSFFLTTVVVDRLQDFLFDVVDFATKQVLRVELQQGVKNFPSVEVEVD
jgi:hypothetical protein